MGGIEYADIVFLNGNVITVNESDEIVDAAATRGKRIIGVGSNKEIQRFIDDKTKIIDLNGKTLMPGFIDSHIHFVMYGLLDNGIINIDYRHARSIKEIKKLISEETRKKKKGEWIVLSGYDHNKLFEKRHPTIEELDEVAPNNPVQCIRCCAHMGVYNTMALKSAGVTSHDKFALGEVVIDEEGKMTGLLKETAHMRISKKVVFSDNDLLTGIKNANDLMLKLGITSVHDAGSYGKQIMKLMQKASQEKLIDVRLRPMVFDMYGKESGKEYISNFLNTGIYTNLGDEHFKLGPIKIMTDGSTSGPSCATIESYCHDSKLQGIQVWKQHEVDEIVMNVNRAQYQMTAHAVGDKAVTLMVNAYEKALQKYPRENHRHRIEHCALTNPKLIERIKKLRIIPVSNPAFITINGSDYNRFYGKRVEYMFPLKSYKINDIITAIGSDSPVTNPNPMYSIYGAVNRKDIKSKEECGVSQKVSILDMVRMFTYNGAYASFEEDIKGSLEVGKLADIIMLSEDITSISPEDYMEVNVKLTMIDGKIVYNNI